MSSSSPIVRNVWYYNLEDEFAIIRDIVDDYPYVSLDTKFPEVVHLHSSGVYHRGDPNENYHLLKANVNAKKAIQIGLTLTDMFGNLPDLGDLENCFNWQFNMNAFDIERDLHASESFHRLKELGIDFAKNREYGVDSAKFAELVMSSGLVCNEEVTWVSFHSAYDFGHLLKMLTGKVLPDDLIEFGVALKTFFGKSVFDVKYLMTKCEGLRGGLVQVAKTLELEVGKSHQAGEDSFLTWKVFEKISKLCPENIEKFSGGLYGLV